MSEYKFLPHVKDFVEKNKPIQKAAENLINDLRENHGITEDKDVLMNLAVMSYYWRLSCQEYEEKYPDIIKKD